VLQITAVHRAMDSDIAARGKGVGNYLERDKYLDRVPGFVAFHLLRGSVHNEYRLYSSHMTWASKEAFTAWTQSEAFRAAHSDAGSNKPLHLGHPEFEEFEAIQTLEKVRQ
jgi:heme-degrading monooxygenase HmoA